MGTLLPLAAWRSMPIFRSRHGNSFVLPWTAWIKSNKDVENIVCTWESTHGMAVGTIQFDLSDDVLLRKAIAGERTSLEELFGGCRLVADRVAHRLLDNEADALDAVQDAFVKALTHLPSFQGRSSFKTWLLRVVSNAALDLGRRRGRREVLSLDRVGGEERDKIDPRALADPGLGLERADLHQLIHQALAKLPDAQRQ